MRSQKSRQKVYKTSKANKRILKIREVIGKKLVLAEELSSPFIKGKTRVRERGNHLEVDQSVIETRRGWVFGYGETK